MAKRDAKHQYRYQNVWQAVDDALSREIQAFWAAENALPRNEDADARAKQAVVVMRDEQGLIAAVSTALCRRVPRLQQNLYYYRTYCAEPHRGQHTMLEILGHSQQALNDYNLGLQTPEAIGVLLELENSMLSGRYTEAHNSQMGYTFIGVSPRGFNLFVRYFPGFKLQALPPLREA